MGVSFTVSVFLQTVRGYNAIETGVIFTAATLGVLVSSLGAERFAKRRSQKTLIMAGFVVTIAGIGLLLALVGASSRVVAFAPGLLLIGLGLGVMLTPSVNVVQSSFPEQLQGEISGLSRSVSNPARPSARRSPARSWFRTSPRGTCLTSSRWSPWPSLPSLASRPPSGFRPAAGRTARWASLSRRAGSIRRPSTGRRLRRDIDRERRPVGRAFDRQLHIACPPSLYTRALADRRGAPNHDRLGGPKAVG